MLITFTCDAHETIVMFGNIGKRLLEMMGFSGKMTGTIQAEEIPLVRSRLRKALDHVGKEPTQSTNEDNDEDADEPKVSLEHRAFTLFAMLDAAEKEKCDVKWSTS